MIFVIISRTTKEVYIKLTQRTGHDIFQDAVVALSRIAEEVDGREEVVELRLRELQAEKRALDNARQIVTAVKR